MSELNQLFEKLLHSELSFNNRIEHLKKLKADIQQHQSQLTQLCEQNERMLGELAIKKQTLADVEVKSKCACITKLTLLEQKDKLLKERNSLKEKIALVIERIDQERMEFLNKSKTFSSEYDMHGVGSKKRYEEARATVTKLEEQLDTLKKEISEGQREKDKMMTLQQQVALMEDDVAKEKGRVAEIRAHLDAQEKEINNLQKEKEALSQKYSTDPEIIKLQKELELYRDRAEDIKCEQLTVELSQLQESYYRHQLEKKSRQHYEKQKEGRLGNAGYIAHYNPYKRSNQQEEQEPKDLMPIEDEWFEAMADEDWVMDIDEDIEFATLDTSENTKSLEHVKTGTESTTKVADEKEHKLTTRVPKKPKKVRFHY